MGEDNAENQDRQPWAAACTNVPLASADILTAMRMWWVMDFPCNNILFSSCSWPPWVHDLSGHQHFFQHNVTMFSCAVQRYFSTLFGEYPHIAMGNPAFSSCLPVRTGLCVICKGVWQGWLLPLVKVRFGVLWKGTTFLNVKQQSCSNSKVRCAASIPSHSD